MGSVRGVRLGSEAKDLARLGFGERPGKVRVSPNGSAVPFGCPSMLWEDVQTSTGEPSLIQHDSEDK